MNASSIKWLGIATNIVTACVAVAALFLSYKTYQDSTERLHVFHEELFLRSVQLSSVSGAFSFRRKIYLSNISSQRKIHLLNCQYLTEFGYDFASGVAIDSCDKVLLRGRQVSFPVTLEAGELVIVEIEEEFVLNEGEEDFLDSDGFFDFNRFVCEQRKMPAFASLVNRDEFSTICNDGELLVLSEHNNDYYRIKLIVKTGTGSQMEYPIFK